MKNSDQIWDLVDHRRQTFVELADRVWDTPELNYGEFRSSDSHAAVLTGTGFRLSRGIGGIPTALLGEAGEGGPVIAILGEYDALPGLSQEAGIAEERPLVAGGNGHGCGHNLLGTAALQAATAVKDWLAQTGLPGRVRYYGCPAEEGGSAKGFMVREGLFDDVDIAISWHPGPFTCVMYPASLACVEVLFHFTGRAAHAAAAPHLGRSALDAVELMNVGVNYMREHMPSTARIHYALIDAGGVAPNVVQAKATVRYLVRARELDEMQALFERVKKVAEGAALMTETTVVCEPVSGEANLLGNDALEALMQRELERLGPAAFDDADREIAAKFHATFNPEDIATCFATYRLQPEEGLVLCDRILPLDSGDPALIGSTDVGTVSWAVPTVQMYGATCAIGTPPHSWQMVAQGKLPLAHKGMEHAAKIMASTAAALIRDPALVEQAKADHGTRRRGRPLANPLTHGVAPALVPAPAGWSFAAP
ncbi:M20 family metallopeptidase [Rhizobiaceae bacterium BDR2-2]|uniref:M20 family metallopeptidase n=1 Tax=Ectorhizobium quercum TaxID=2965071 RepID=A0AAE3SWP2_9HYPH|nr:M20 family metallopeptidase [Ectorhizobium quercum]MCX8998244.1 M20 family metallopeptidase [Ectorhizobium quercum]